MLTIVLANWNSATQFAEVVAGALEDGSVGDEGVAVRYLNIHSLLTRSWLRILFGEYDGAD